MRRKTKTHTDARKFMHEERKLTPEEALGRLPPGVPYLTAQQFARAVGITDELPIRKWIHQERIQVVKTRSRGGAQMFARADVVRFVTNRFSPYSLLEARLFRSGVSLIASVGATGRLATDRPALHTSLDALLNALDPSAYEAAVRSVRSGGGRLLVLVRTSHSSFERAFLRSALRLVAATGASRDLEHDRSRFHDALNDYIAGFGGEGAYEWAVRERARQLGIKLPPRRRAREWLRSDSH